MAIGHELRNLAHDSVDLEVLRRVDAGDACLAHRCRVDGRDDPPDDHWDIGAVGSAVGFADVIERVKAMPGGPPKLLVAKPGLDGHSNGAEQIAVAGRDAGMEVIYQGIRLTPEQIAVAARDEDVDVIGISILSGSHLELIPEILRLLQEAGVEAPVVVGGIIPADDRPKLESLGVAAVYTPKDFELTRIMTDISALAASRRTS